MTGPGQAPIPPIIPVTALPDADGDEAARPGWTEDDPADDARDDDGTPVGRADARADAERTGADPDVV